ncbi:hypothetical protein BDY24DRAFT_389696, partial [Mrakia frigida]|uniref:uncharacterized protein n=1 Tax=Mrakia frigida TaxID=29902 RepID=UPI003FCBFCE4
MRKREGSKGKGRLQVMEEGREDGSWKPKGREGKRRAEHDWGRERGFCRRKLSQGKKHAA